MTSPPKSAKVLLYRNQVGRHERHVQQQLLTLQEEMRLASRRSLATDETDRSLLLSTARSILRAAAELVEHAGALETLRAVGCFLEPDGPEPDFVVDSTLPGEPLFRIPDAAS